MTEREMKLKEALIYAGKLAIEANKVITSNAKQLSTNIVQLEIALEWYDKFILSMEKEERNDIE